MNWEAIGAAGEVMGAVAVVLTLVYLSAQIRAGNRALHISQRDSALDSVKVWNHHVMTDESLADVIHRGTTDYDGLSETERVRFGHCFYAFFKAFENIYIQSLDGSTSVDVWEGNRNALFLYARQPGVQQWLERGHKLLDSRFVAMLEARPDTR